MIRVMLVFLCTMLFATTAFAATLPPVVRSTGLVHLQVHQPGPFSLSVLKRDLNNYEGEDLLHLTLYDPAGIEILTHTIPDDGITEIGPDAEAYQRFETTVDAAVAGRYRLLVTGSVDLVWGMETSASGYVLEGPEVLTDAALSGSICFAPPSREFAITLRAIRDRGVQTVTLSDDAGERLGEFTLSEAGTVQTLEFPEAERDGLWSLDFEALDVRIDLGRWVRYWTFEADAWFDVEASRQMLLPHSFTRYLQPGESAEIDFRLLNRLDREGIFNLELIADERLQSALLGPASPVTLEAGETMQLRVRVTAPEDAREGQQFTAAVRASALNHPAATTFSGIDMRIGESPATQPLEMPIELEPLAYENALFGYAPDYMRNETYFDAENRPWIRQRTDSSDGTTGVYTLTEGSQWAHFGFEDAIREKYPEYRTSRGGGGFAGAKLAFDGEGGIYTTLRLEVADEQFAVLVFSPDDGSSWQVFELRGSQAEVEQFTGHNALDIPPPILAFEFVAPHAARFCSYHDLWLYMPRRGGDRLVLGEPIKVAEAVVGSCQHSGGPASSATQDGRTHIVWGAVSGEPDGSGADERGVPTYATTYDHATGEVGEQVLLGHGPPVNDVHNVPAITIDSEGYLHVVIGAHGNPFRYVHSLHPNDASTWTEPEIMLTRGFVRDDGSHRGRQTYISLVCDQHDTLHVASRQNRNDGAYHGFSSYRTLSIQHRPKNGRWTRDATPLVIAAFPGYSIWYHKLTIDRLGHLWLSYGYWSRHAVYESHYPGRYYHRAVLLSRDGGITWKLAETSDFTEGLHLAGDG